MIFTVTVHLTLFDSTEVVFQKVLDGEAHGHRPDVLPVVENAGVFLLLLSSVEEATQEGDQALFEDPLEDAPENPEILVLEVSGVRVGRLELQPRHIVDLESVEQSHFGEHFEAIEPDKGVYFLIEDLLVLARDEISWEYLRNELSQEVSHITIAGFSLEKFLEDGLALS